MHLDEEIQGDITEWRLRKLLWSSRKINSNIVEMIKMYNLYITFMVVEMSDHTSDTV